MKYERVRDLLLPKIGFGTWNIGGGSSPDPKTDAVGLAALRCALDTGYSHFDTAEYYAAGHSEELLGRAARESLAQREALFITSKVWPSHLKYDQVLKSCENSLRRLQMDYLDLYLVHWPEAGMKLKETFRGLNKLVRDGKVKNLGVSNFNVELLQEAQALSETPLLTNQVPFSLSDRSYIKNSVFEYCQRNEILLTAYSPMDLGNLKHKSLLETLSSAHGATPHQITLAWIISQPRTITIPMSTNPRHIAENFQAADIELSAQEIEQLTNGSK
jgi:diketogulonate reductase-like aldo/keto reductase